MLINIYHRKAQSLISGPAKTRLTYMKDTGASMNSVTMSVLSWDVPNLQIARAVFLDIENKNTTCPVNSKDKQSIEFKKI